METVNNQVATIETGANMMENTVEASKGMLTNLVDNVKEGTTTGHVVVGVGTAAVLGLGYWAWRKFGGKK